MQLPSLPLLFKLFAISDELFLSDASRKQSVVWLLVVVVVTGHNCSILCHLILLSVL